MAGAEKIGEFGIWYVVFLLTLTLHEAGHALVAWLGGDDTAYRGGQVSLSPWPHIRREPIGTLIVPIVTYLTNGWMMGWASTPYDPLWGQRHPRRQAAMAAAGPAANLLIALVVFGTLKLLLGVGLFVAPDHADFNQVVSPSPGAAPGSWAWPAAFLGLWNLWGYDLWAPDEPYFAEGAREMLADGQWAVPHVNGTITTDKPPLFFWIIALLSLPAGRVTPLTARLPSALAGLGSVVLAMRLARRAAAAPGTARLAPEAPAVSGEADAGLAGLGLATTHLHWDKARSAQIDALLAFLILAALSAFVE